MDTPPQNASVIFLRHSTGAVIWSNGVLPAIDEYNDLNNKNYIVGEDAYPDAPYPWANYPYDYWYLWALSCGQPATPGVPTLDSFTDNNDVIVFSHDYPVSHITADTGNPDISSSSKTIENYKLQYATLKDLFHQHPDNQFILWTGAALVEGSSTSEEGQRARNFFTWVKQQWDEPGDNIFLWDFFELETEGGNFLLDSYSVDGSSSSPETDFAQTVAPFLAQRIIDVIEGRGDSGSLTGK